MRPAVFNALAVMLCGCGSTLDSMAGTWNGMATTTLANAEIVNGVGIAVTQTGSAQVVITVSGASGSVRGLCLSPYETMAFTGSGNSASWSDGPRCDGASVVGVSECLWQGTYSSGKLMLTGSTLTIAALGTAVSSECGLNGNALTFIFSGTLQ